MYEKNSVEVCCVEIIRTGGNCRIFQLLKKLPFAFKGAHRNLPLNHSAE
jgi:hypothetical protein